MHVWLCVLARNSCHCCLRVLKEMRASRLVLHLKSTKVEVVLLTLDFLRKWKLLGGGWRVPLPRILPWKWGTAEVIQMCPSRNLIFSPSFLKMHSIFCSFFRLLPYSILGRQSHIHPFPSISLWRQRTFS